MVRLGIDLGGTKTEVLALADDGRVLVRRRVSTPSHEYAAIVEMLVDLIGEVEAELGERGSIGIGTPGSPSPTTGRMRNANTVVLNDKPLQADLEARLGRAVRLANDANCFALSEAVDGAGQGAAVVFGVILGTGVGGGVVVHGKPLIGRNAVAGEWGHNPLPWPTEAELPGRACYCGKSGCIETFVSGPGLAIDHERVTGEHLHGPEIVARAEVGDAAAVATLERYEGRLARALATVINAIDPDIIVLGGGVSNIRRLYETVPRMLAAHVFSDAITTPIVPPKHGDSSGVRGAAWLW